MAILIPESPKDCPYGERITYERLGRDLNAEWVILHSLGLHGHETKIWGEADIVVLSTLGFFALEVKGGRVSCQDGIWSFGGPYGPRYTKKEDPWTQAKGTMFAIRNVLVGKDASFDDILFGFGVVMPMERFITTGAEIEPAVLLDKRDFHRPLSFYINNLLSHWKSAYQSKHGKIPRLPTRADIKRARALLRPDIDSAYSIGSHLTGIEAQLVQLSNDQIRASRRMLANPRTIVRGKAGTGKTVIALERARQLAKDGIKVLYLCFNQLLAEHVRTSLKKDPANANIDVWHVHALYRDVIEKAGLLDLLDADGEEKVLFGEVFPRVFVDAMLQTDIRPWGALIVDEAQDLLTQDNLDAFDLLLASGLNRGRWHIFFDPLQNIYGAELQGEVEDRLKESQPAFDDLFENCRNTRQVAVQTSITSGIDMAVDGAPDGPACDNIYFKNQTSFVAQLTELIEQLVKHDVRPQDIAILSTRKRENSLVKDMSSVGGIPLADVAQAGAGQIAFATMHAFKGLERTAVIAVDMGEIGQPSHSMLHYAGLSRARALLRIFLPEAARPTYGKQAAAFAKRLAEQ